MDKKYKTGLVLSGGGMRGFAHLGVISALYDAGIKPDIISGTSAGAIVGAFIAGGKTPEEILNMLKKGGFFKYTKLHLPIDGLLKLDGLKEVIQKKIKAANIEDLEMPLFISVSNLNKGIVEYKNSGPLGEIVLASSSIPILFSPVTLNGDVYADGGLLDNIPIAPIKNDCEKIIVSNISPVNPVSELKNLIQIASRTFYMSVKFNLEEVKDVASVYIEPDGIENYDVLSRSHADELYELGYNAAKKQLQGFQL